MDVSSVSAIFYEPYASVAVPRSPTGDAAQGKGQGAAQSSAGIAQSSADSAKPAGKSEQPAAAEQSGSAKQPGTLSKAQLEQVRQLQKRDQEVRQHEMAHLAASGGLAVSGATYSFQRGPDGVSYAVGGEVNINMSPGRTPQETIARAETIIAAALAPAEPSGQDRAVAAQARQMERQAMAQQMAQQVDKMAQALQSGAQAQHAGIGMYRQVAAAATPDAAAASSGSFRVTA